MPIWLRNLTFKMIHEHYESLNNKEKPEDTWVKGSAREIAKENNKIQVPTYVTRASKK
mgnify:FL=1